MGWSRSLRTARPGRLPPSALPPKGCRSALRNGRRDSAPERRDLVVSGVAVSRLEHCQSRHYRRPMDFSGLISIPLAAVITAGWMIVAAIVSKNGPGFRAPFLMSYGLGVLFMEPWRITAWQELGMFAIMLVMLALWVAAGCIIGGIPAAVIVALVEKLWRRFEH